MPSGGSSAAGGGNAGASGGVKSAGCGKPAPLAAPAQQSVMIDGASRGYFLAPPAPYDSGTAYAVVFAYHGSGGNGSGLRGYFGLEAASAGKAIFVYPDGVGGIWDLKNSGSDAKLFDAVLATLSANWCIDTGAVFAAGFSYGGWAATQMAAARPTVVRGVASIEGGGPQGASNDDPAVAAMIIHGKNDGAEPLASGEGSRDHFLKIDGCGSTSSAITPAPCVTYANCKPQKAVAWCEHDGAHEIPAFAPAAIWAFFSSVR
jgi:polyhydroxybutyrate depolymerase